MISDGNVGNDTDITVPTTPDEIQKGFADFTGNLPLPQATHFNIPIKRRFLALRPILPPQTRFKAL